MKLSLAIASLITVASARPNVIIMQPDDLEFYEQWAPPAHLPGNSVQQAKLPNLEKFRLGGMQMNRAYAASPMCGTSRYATITGRYPSRSASTSRRDTDDLANVVIPSTKLIGSDCSTNNLAAAFETAGYKTGVVGKWHLSNVADPYNYSAVQQTIRDCGFDVAEAIYPENLDGDWAYDGLNHNTEYIVDRAFGVMDQAVANNEEFFLYINPTAPHSSGNVLEALTNSSCLDTPDGTIAQEPDIVGMTRNLGCKAYRESVIARASDTSNAALGAVWVDDAVGAILEKLKAIGQLENTFFLFQLDHGQEGKATMLETGTRMAQLVHYPAEIEAGSVFNGLVSNIDIGPTVMDYAGIGEQSPGYFQTDGSSWKDVIGTRPRAWSNRCIISEGGTDRTVSCGCDKYLYIPNDDTSITVKRRITMLGVVTETALFDMCNEDGDYITSPADTPETEAVDDAETLARLNGVLQCHLNMTRPDITMDEYGVCDELNFSGGNAGNNGGGGNGGDNGGGGGGNNGGGNGGGGSTTCSANIQPNFGRPGASDECLEVSRGDSLTYPNDFAILNEVQHYVCPASNQRIIVSNGIPDHDIRITNPNPPCALNWMLKVPLVPSYSSEIVEPSPLGLIAMSLNGVPMYGPQESGSENAVEQAIGSNFMSVPFFGHAAARGDWHYHSGEFGRTTSLDLDELTSETLLGYAADGFPIYGPAEDPGTLDECNGIQAGATPDTYRYHVRKFADIDENSGYCDGDSPAIKWNYVIGCFKGDLSTTEVVDSSQETIPTDCVPVDPANVPDFPSAAPSGSPSASPLSAPSSTPSTAPSSMPSKFPTASPVASSPGDRCSLFNRSQRICQGNRAVDGRRCHWSSRLGSCESPRPCESIKNKFNCRSHQCAWKKASWKWDRVRGRWVQSSSMCISW